MQSTYLSMKRFNFEPTLFDEPSKKWQISGMYSCCRWTWITAGRVITWLICRYAWPPNTTRVTPHPIRSQSALLAPVITCMALLGCYVWSGNHMARPPAPLPCWPYHITALTYSQWITRDRNQKLLDPWNRALSPARITWEILKGVWGVESKGKTTLFRPDMYLGGTRLLKDADFLVIKPNIRTKTSFIQSIHLRMESSL